MHEIGASDLRSTGRFSAQLLASTELLHNETHGDSLAPGPPPPAVSHLRVALYGRVSTKDKGQETENQLAQLREFCKRQEWPIVEEYVDHASGKRSDRVRFLALFADAAQRKFDLVLFWSLDRFSREGVLDTLQHLQKLTAAKVEWKSFTEQPCLRFSPPSRNRNVYAFRSEHRPVSKGRGPKALNSELRKRFSTELRLWSSDHKERACARSPEF